MELEEIRRVVCELDASVPREGAKVNIQKYDDGTGEESGQAFIIANERGYLRLGIEFLKAGLDPLAAPEKSAGKRPDMILVDLDYVFTEDSDVRFDYFERREDVEAKTEPETWGDKLFIFAVLGVIVAIFALAVVGLVTIVRALF